jgi:hypothetical protein
MTGPTTVPWRVRTASMADAAQLMRFMTFSSSAASSAASLSQSASLWMKNVVLPESPYGVCTTRSWPRPASSASARSSA